MAWPRFIREHPVFSVLGSVAVFLVVTVPIWLAQVWTLFSDRPFATVMGEQEMEWFAVTSWYGWFCLGLGLVLTGRAFYAVLKGQWQAPYPTVEIWYHTQGSEELGHRIRDLFARAGWKVLWGSRTDLPQHASGIWLCGGTQVERNSAKWGLSTIDVSPEVDRSNNPANLQVVVGKYVPATIIRIRQPVTPSASLSDAIRGEPEIRVPRLGGVPEPARPSKTAAVTGLAIDVRLFTTGPSSPTGIQVAGINRAAKAVESVALVMTDLRVWDAHFRQFVTTPDIHGQARTFPQETELTNRVTLHPGTPAVFGFIRIQDGRMQVSGHPREYRSTREGLWEISFRVGPNNKNFIEGRACFEWTNSGDGAAAAPSITVLPCPKKATKG
jgi:hypothetical protein